MKARPNLPPLPRPSGRSLAVPAGRLLGLALAPLLVLALAFLPAQFGGEALAGKSPDAFSQARDQFQSLSGNRQKAALRGNWERVERAFLKIAKDEPRSPKAAASLLYLGRIYETLGRKSGLPGDFQKAQEYYSRAIKEFPDHADMAELLFRRGQVGLRLGQPDQARADFRALVRSFPRAQEASKAREELKDLGPGEPEPEKAAPVRASGRPETSRPAQDPVPPAKTAGRDQPKVLVGGLRLTKGDDHTRVTITLDREAPFRHQTLPSLSGRDRPSRLALTLDNAVLGRKVQPEFKLAGGKSVIRSEKDGAGVRITLDFEDAREFKIFSLSNPYRIVVDVLSPGPLGAESAGAEAGGSRPGRKKDPRYTPPQGSRKLAANLVEQLGLRVSRVMIDPGHGGNDPGARANGLVEKELNLRFARILGRELERKGFEVSHTRTADRYLALEARTSLANEKKADLFISIHCNANNDASVSGLETYSLNLASSKHAVHVAARENAVEAKNISDLQVILTDLMLSSKLKESRDAAGSIQNRTVGAVQASFPLHDHGVREAPFYVLMGAKMPSVLIELGYLTNKAEAKRLASDKYLQTLARGIAAGVSGYKNQIERFAAR